MAYYGNKYKIIVNFNLFLEFEQDINSPIFKNIVQIFKKVKNRNSQRDEPSGWDRVNTNVLKAQKFLCAQHGGMVGQLFANKYLRGSKRGFLNKHGCICISSIRQNANLTDETSEKKKLSFVPRERSVACCSYRKNIKIST